MSVDIKPAFHPKPPSDLFIDAVVDSGSITDTCEFCGRTFFEDDENRDWAEGEFEKLKERNGREPDKCVAIDQIRTGTLAGKRGVVGCPCNWATPYENFIWGERHMIMKFISAKVKGIVEKALVDESAADSASADLKQEEIAKETVRCPKCLKFRSKLAIHEEGEVCLTCWEVLQKEAEEKRERERLQEIADEQADRLLHKDDIDLPF